MRSLTSTNRCAKYLSCIIDVFTKNASVKPLKDKKPKNHLHGFVDIVKRSKRKPNKLWFHQGR